MNDSTRMRSLWHDTLGSRRRYWPPLTGDADADVVIIGAGITGLTTAWHLLRAGARVVVLEAGEVGGGTTGASTGNLYVPISQRLHVLAGKHGHKAAEAVVAARIAAINFIETLASEYTIACDFQRVPFHLFSAPDDSAAKDVEKEFACAQRLGLAANDAIPSTFPFQVTALTTISQQAQFNPLQYVTGLAEVLAGMGCIIHENSRVLENVDGEPCKVSTELGTVTAQHVVKATHVPQGLYAVHAAMIPHREYAVLAEVGEKMPASGIYWNASECWRYSLRPWRSGGRNFLMVLGEPHKPGEQHAEQLNRIRQFLHTHYAVSEITHTWAAQNYPSADLLPYIGTSPVEKHTWMATGFAADGLVWGTVAGKVISDGIQQRSNSWAQLFAPTRFTPVASAKNVLKESAAVSRHLLQDVFSYGKAEECSSLAPGEGCVIKVDGEKLAACRDHAGQLHVVSAVCTHMGCLVRWNGLEMSWDCPCHGSRFSIEGRVLEGPAQHDLSRPR